MKRVAIVTGASRGIGLAISNEFLKNGVSVIGVSRSHETLAKVQRSFAEVYGHSAFIPCTADIAKSEEIASIVQCLEDTKMELCALVNNAAVVEPFAKIADIDIDEWRHSIEVNVTSVIALTQRLIPALRKSKGCVVNVSSGAASYALHGLSTYCVSKAALNMVTKSIAVEEPDIVALAIGPGSVDTDMQDVIRNSGKQSMSHADYAMLKGLHETGSLLPPEKPAHATVKLALRAPKEITGQFHSWDSPEIVKYIE